MKHLACIDSPEWKIRKWSLKFGELLTLCQLGEYCHCLEFKDEWEKEEAEWNSKSEEEKDAFLAEFNAQVYENQRKRFEDDLPF